MRHIKCTLTVNVDEEKMKKLGYESIADYLNECSFCVYDDDHDDICGSVDEYDISENHSETEGE